MTKQELFNENKNLVYDIYNTHLKNMEYNKRLKEDAIQEGLIALWKSCLNYNPEKGAKFSTYAYNSILKAMKCFCVRQYKKAVCLVSLEAPLTENDSSVSFEDILPCNTDLLAQIEIDTVFNQLFSTLDEQSKDIVTYLKQGYSKKEIAELVQESQGKITNILRKFRKALKNTLFFED